MMQEIYNQISLDNIIDDKEYLEKMLNFYKTTARPVGDVSEKKLYRRSDFYDFLTKNDISKADLSDIDVTDCEDFYVEMTNKWISNILSLNDERLSFLSKNGLKEYGKIKKYLESFGKVVSMHDIEKLYINLQEILNDDFSLEKNNYFWRHLQNSCGFNSKSDYYGDFTHVNSRYGKARQESDEDVDYRLYINCANKDMFKIIKSYVYNCEKNNMHYYFKYQVSDKRKDKILIYSSKEQIGNNIAILRNIAKMNPEIVSSCGERLELTGNIDNWIGIASEPDEKYMTHKQSFNTLRAEIFEDAAEQLILNYIKMNLKNNEMKNKAIDLACVVIIKEMQSKGCSSELFTSSYIANLKNALGEKFKNQNISPIIMGFKTLENVMPKKNDMAASIFQPIFKLKQPNGKDFNYSIYIVDKVLKLMVDEMKKNDSMYLEKYKEEIKRKCIKYGVDPNNFSLNISSLEDFKNVDEINNELLFDSEKEVDDNDSNSNSHDKYLKNLYYVRGVLDLLPFDVLKNKINISNDVSISLGQYIGEYIIDKMDDQFKFYDVDGNYVSVSDFVKKYIERLKNSKNESKLNWNKLNYEYVEGIISMLTKDELNTVIKINDSIVSLRQFATEYIVSRMDDKHNFISETGEKISVSDLIKRMVRKDSKYLEYDQQFKSKK